MKLLIKGGRVINPGKDFDAVSDVLVENGKIVAIGENLEASDAKVIDAKGKVVAPGFIDMHTHLRELKKILLLALKLLLLAGLQQLQQCQIQNL